MDCNTPGLPVHHKLPEFTQTHVHWVRDAIQPSRPFSPFSPHPPSIFPSIKVFSNESIFHIRWPKYWSFSFSMCPSNEYSGLISFKMDWFAFLAVQGTFKSLVQHHGSKASILSCSAFFIVQLSHSYCCAPCLNPRAGREKASKTMQLAKRGSLLLTRARALCRIQSSGAGQRAPSPSCYTSL